MTVFLQVFKLPPFVGEITQLKMMDWRRVISALVQRAVIDVDALRTADRLNVNTSLICESSAGGCVTLSPSTSGGYMELYGQKRVALLIT